jgi:hypothetical protein
MHLDKARAMTKQFARIRIRKNPRNLYPFQTQRSGRREMAQMRNVYLRERERGEKELYALGIREDGSLQQTLENNRRITQLEDH